MPISEQQRRTLRGAAHKLKPVVLLGKAALSEAVLEEINAALDHHELIKVKVRGDDRDERRLIIDDMARKTGAELIQTIGQIAVLYRPAPEQAKKKPAPTKPAKRPARAAAPARKPSAPARRRS
jgi:RNA-binding protein